ncbi:histidine kinase [Pseudomaricurvus alcaniphilus]|uniref:TorF family putative porin n=1 Tax=Pseudomaricurvus alcaniphilus TaxID=1166482 RepID=UPI00140772A6|nr:TorF family putative porin [Pseudomaricurvus alcaniphilus]NHN38618.1 histidine kinase [Pseudomaricurvus alcaniphilus]
MNKVTQLAAAVALTAGAISAAPVAMAAETSASVAVASSYLWRGFDLGSGTPAVSGDITVSEGGFYAGVWGSSGDDLNGTEYDLYAGWGGEFSGLSVDLSVWNYIYPTGPNASQERGPTPGFADLSEVILTLGFGPVSFSYYDNIAGGSGYEYYTLSGSYGKFSATLGFHDAEVGAFVDDVELDPVHLDVSYSYNDNLSFTLSQVIEDDEVPGDELKFVVGYSLPLDM